MTILNIRDAKITEKGACLVIDKKAELEKKSLPRNRGEVVNILLNEMAELKESHPEFFKQKL